MWQLAAKTLYNVITYMHIIEIYKEQQKKQLDYVNAI